MILLVTPEQDVLPTPGKFINDPISNTESRPANFDRLPLSSRN
jgi:hypothetical protein